MRIQSWLAVAALILAVSPTALGHDKKKHLDRAMLESMQSVPCGAKERGLAGLGSVFGSVGVEHVNSHEQLCPQYFLRTDSMDYHIRPLDLKHATVLPIGHEVEYKIKNDRMMIKVVDGDKKTRAYQVVSMQPSNKEDKPESARETERPSDRQSPPAADRQPAPASGPAAATQQPAPAPAPAENQSPATTPVGSNATATNRANTQTIDPPQQ